MASIGNFRTDRGKRHGCTRQNPSKHDAARRAISSAFRQCGFTGMNAVGENQGTGAVPEACESRIGLGARRLRDQRIPQSCEFG